MNLSTCVKRVLFFTLLVGGLLSSSQVALAGEDPPTLHIYGEANSSAGDAEVLTEDAPYTGIDGLNSIFDPDGPQAPRQDSVTWNPAWMYENETLDENQSLGLYHQIFSDDINVAEKVWFRLWYEPVYQDVPLTIDEGPIADYPAIMEEFTYILMEAPEFAAVGDSWPPQPISGPAGSTQFVFPVGIKRE